MYHLSAQSVDERMINVHYYYVYGRERTRVCACTCVRARVCVCVIEFTPRGFNIVLILCAVDLMSQTRNIQQRHLFSLSFKQKSIIKN